MTSFNKLVIAGRLVRDPELKELRNNLTVARITIVSNEILRSYSGEEKEEACYLECALWDEEALRAKKYLSRGSAIVVSGKLKLERWKDKNSGMERSKHVLVADKRNGVMYLEKLEPLIDGPGPRVSGGSRVINLKQEVSAPPLKEKRVVSAPPNDEDHDELPF